MDAQILDAHEISPSVYRISGPRPASIRDQIVRSRLLVEHLFATKRIAAGSKLLIVGGGAAGVSAMMAAASKGASIVLLEKEAHLFAAQKSSARYVYPTFYDWPAQHWSDDRFPPSAHLQSPRLGKELVWVGSHTAGQLASFWDHEVAAWQRQQGNNNNIDIRCNFEFEIPWLSPPPSSGLPVTINYPNNKVFNNLPKQFSAVLLCMGFGTDRTVTRQPQNSAFSSPGFWEPDQLATPVPNGKVVRIAISGGGDGALQDYIRTLTANDDVQSTFDKLIANAHAPFQKLNSSDFLLKACHAEDAFTRRWVFNSPDTADCEMYTLWHQRFSQDIIDPVWNACSQQQLDDAKRILRPDINNIEPTLYHSCSHFDKTYPANRVMSLLLDRLYCAATGRCSTIIPTHRALEIREHKSDPRGRYELTFNALSCSNNSLQPNPTAFADIIVIRHGVDSPSYPKLNPTNKKPHQRQVLPYFVD